MFVCIENILYNDASTEDRSKKRSQFEPLIDDSSLQRYASTKPTFASIGYTIGPHTTPKFLSLLFYKLNQTIKWNYIEMRLNFYNNFTHIFTFNTSMSHEK